MTIIISGKPALLKKGSSFDFISENRFFTGADAYTLSITFPLRGCKQNTDIFGHINRKDSDLERLLLDCEIHDQNFHAYGSISIVDISEVEVKTQFLEGRSAQNFYSDLDDTYINEIPMSSLHVELRNGTAPVLRSYEEQQHEGYLGYVCLPWVNNTSGNIQNEMSLNDSKTEWVYRGGGYPEVVAQPFLIEVIRKVLDATGYSYNINKIEDSVYADLIVCNAFPKVWDMPAMNLILPHWTISEFLAELETFLNGQFNIERSTHELTFSFNKDLLAGMKEVTLENVIDVHQVEISNPKDVKDTFSEQKNIAYQDGGHQMQKFYSCNWAKTVLPTKTYSNFQSMVQQLDPYLDAPVTYNSRGQFSNLHYCIKENTYFVLKCVGTYVEDRKGYRLMGFQPVNMFAPRIYNTREDAEMLEMGIVPACIDNTDKAHGDMIFIECGTLGDDSENENVEDYQSPAVKTLAAGEKEKKDEYFDKLFVAFWDGNATQYFPACPRPYIDKYEVKQNNTLIVHPGSLRLSGPESSSQRAIEYRVDQSKKFTFSFLSDTIPDVRSIFFVHGKRYLAEKITCSFSETGMSKLLKMVAYRII